MNYPRHASSPAHSVFEEAESLSLSTVESLSLSTVESSSSSAAAASASSSSASSASSTLSSPSYLSAAERRELGSFVREMENWLGRFPKQGQDEISPPRKEEEEEKKNRMVVHHRANAAHALAVLLEADTQAFYQTMATLHLSSRGGVWTDHSMDDDKNAASAATAIWIQQQNSKFAITASSLASSRRGRNRKNPLAPQRRKDASFVVEEYWQLYLSSIPSFCQMLLESSPHQLEANPLDGMVEHEPFQNPDFVSDFLSMKHLVAQGFPQYVQGLKRKMVHYEKCHSELREAQRRLHQVQVTHNATVAMAASAPAPAPALAEQETAAPAADQEPLAIGEDLFQSTVGRLANLFSPSAAAPPEKGVSGNELQRKELDGEETAQQKEDNDKNNKNKKTTPRESRKLRRLRKHLDHEKACVDEALRRLKAVSGKLRQLREKRVHYLPPLSDQEFHEANAAFSRVVQSLRGLLAHHIQQRHSLKLEQYRTLDEQTDLTKPHEWYPRVRMDRRRIIFHAGPTNSGKTYTALQRLKQAKRGLYLGPLRLLAVEVYEKLTSQGVYTNLLTGQEKRQIPFATHWSATVEMAPTHEDFDVVVIDEIQMLANPNRGCAWTKALLGLRCREVHVCGGLEARDLLEKIVRDCGDDLEVHTYHRFSPLHVASEAISPTSGTLGSYRNVQPGDCVVAFSRNDIFAIQREIERKTPFKCCVIYGTLPPATRTDQARRFNDPNSGHDILVASDAIGMGLNLNIRRIIFNTIYKWNGHDIARLDHSAVKQISGRAGRRNSLYSEGYVTCRDPADLPHIRSCLTTDVGPIPKAGLIPTANHIELFSHALRLSQGNVPQQQQQQQAQKATDELFQVLGQFSEMATLQGNYFLCRQTSMRAVAKMLDALPLSIAEKYTLCMAPVNDQGPRSMSILKKYAQKYAAGEVSGLGRYLSPQLPKSFDDLSLLCTMHNELELFLWLQNRLVGNVMEQQAATTLKEQTIDTINAGLAQSERLVLDHCYIRRDQSLREMWAAKNRESNEELVQYFIHGDKDDGHDHSPNTFQVDEW